MNNMSGNPVSKVWIEDGLVYKQQPKYLTDNEEWALAALYDSGYVPKLIERIGHEIIVMEYIMPYYTVNNPDGFMSLHQSIMLNLTSAGLVHGDITPYAMIVRANGVPALIDWGESRTVGDPRPPKRRRPDSVMLLQTMSAYARGEVDDIHTQH